MLAQSTSRAPGTWDQLQIGAVAELSTLERVRTAHGVRARTASSRSGFALEAAAPRDDCAADSELAPAVEAALEALCERVNVEARFEYHDDRSIREQLHKSLRAQVFDLERRTARRRDRGAFSDGLRHRLGKVNFAIELRLLLRPEALQRGVAQIIEVWDRRLLRDAAEARRLSRAFEEKVVVEGGAPAPAPDADADDGGDGLHGAAYMRPSAVRPLALPRFDHDIRALVACRQKRHDAADALATPAPATTAPDGVAEAPAPRLAPPRAGDDDDLSDGDSDDGGSDSDVSDGDAFPGAGTAAPPRRTTPRERYLTSIFSSLVVQHQAGNSILDDYPVPERFQDALEAFPATKRVGSIRELGFDVVSLKPTDAPLGNGAPSPNGAPSATAPPGVLVFRPRPFIKVDSMDDGAEALFRLRPPTSQACLGALSCAATAGDVRAVVHDVRAALQTGSKHRHAAAAADAVAALRGELRDRHPEATLARPVEHWTDEPLARLAITGALSPGEYDDERRRDFVLLLPDAPPPTAGEASAVGRRRTDSREAAPPAAETGAEDFSQLPGHAQLRAATRRLRENEELEEGCAAINAVDWSLAARIGSRPRTSAAVDAAEGDAGDAADAGAAAAAAEPPWMVEREPRPLAAVTLARLERIWETLGVDELDRLDFICKFSHRAHAPHALKVAAVLERLAAPLAVAHAAADFLVAALRAVADESQPAAAAEVAGKIQKFNDHLQRVYADVEILHRDFDERVYTRDAPVAHQLVALRRRVLAAVPRSYFDDDAAADDAAAAAEYAAEYAATETDGGPLAPKALSAAAAADALRSAVRGEGAADVDDASSNVGDDDESTDESAFNPDDDDNTAAAE